MEALLIPIVVFLAMLMACIWGLLNPGRIQWGRTGIPVSAPALWGGLIFLLVAAAGLYLFSGVSRYFDDVDHLRWATFALICIGTTGWVIAAVTWCRDSRAAKQNRHE